MPTRPCEMKIARNLPTMCMHERTLHQSRTFTSKKSCTFTSDWMIPGSRSCEDVMYYKDGLPKRRVVMNLSCDDAAAWDPESVERKSAQDLDAKTR